MDDPIKTYFVAIEAFEQADMRISNMWTHASDLARALDRPGQARVLGSEVAFEDSWFDDKYPVSVVGPEAFPSHNDVATALHDWHTRLRETHRLWKEIPEEEQKRIKSPPHPLLLVA